jgi:hypothetical protein
VADELDGKRAIGTRTGARLRPWRRFIPAGVLVFALAGGATIAVGHARAVINMHGSPRDVRIAHVHKAAPITPLKETTPQAVPTPVETPPTTIIIYHPWTRDGGLIGGLGVAHTVDGQCPLRSADNNQAWRCFGTTNTWLAGQAVRLVYDSCFLSPIDTSLLACIEDPWQREVELLRVPSPLPQGAPDYNGANPSGVVWALELTDGRRCGFISGATAAIGDKRLNYVCPDGTSLRGEPDHSKAVWSILASPPGTNVDDPAFHTNPQLFPLAVKTAWF